MKNHSNFLTHGVQLILNVGQLQLLHTLEMMGDEIHSGHIKKLKQIVNDDLVKSNINNTKE